jgi:hypothetical protein
MNSTDGGADIIGSAVSAPLRYGRQGAAVQGEQAQLGLAALITPAAVRERSG